MKTCDVGVGLVEIVNEGIDNCGDLGVVADGLVEKAQLGVVERFVVGHGVLRRGRLPDQIRPMSSTSKWACGAASRPPRPG
jgi:hypothetical protein